MSFSWKGSWLKTWLAVSTLALGACGGEDEKDDEGPKDNGDIVVGWDDAPDTASQALGEALQDEELFEQLADVLNGSFKFPRNLPVVHTACGEENAFYDPTQGGIFMCYELLSSIAQLAYDPALSEDEIGERVIATWMFVYFHELGHALVDFYSLPTTGREEDAVDDFSAVLLIEADLAEFAIRAAEYWAATDSGEYDTLSYADEHSLNAQRFFNILCTVYGSNPEKYEELVTDGYLPESRAARCPAEYQMKRDSWETLLEPWAK